VTERLPFVDAHHHFWDPPANPHPWLVEEPMIPFRYGDYSAIRRPFLVADYQAVAARQNVIASVTMEGEWDRRDPVGETAWLARLRERHGTPAAHVAQAWLDADDVEEVLAAQAAFSFVRGVRHKPRSAARPDAARPGEPGSMGDPAFARGYALLARHGFSFDLQTPWWHLEEAAALAERHPDIPIILNHTGLPADRSPEGIAGWRAALRHFARLPHAAIKISGLGLRGRPWRLEDNRPIIREAIDIFGTDRAMFASNFPVDSLVGDFDTIIDGFRAAVADLPREEQAKLFSGNAIRIYRLEGIG
jgi:Predicted metal-dependent hydrolase of the TIM-barrel fold